MEPASKVKVHYTGTLNDGTVFDSSQGREPLEFSIGQNEVIKGFEEGIKGMKIGEEKTITIASKDAYGDKNEQLVMEVPRDKFPMQIEVGGRLFLKGPEGQQIPAVISEIKGDIVVVDLNHPLAGKDLTFKINLIAVN